MPDVLGDVFKFRNDEAVVATGPAIAAVRATEKSSVTSCIDHVRISRFKGDCMLIGMNRASGVIRNNGPSPSGSRKIATIGFDRAHVDFGVHVRRSLDIPVVPGLPCTHAGRQRGSRCPRAASAAPQVCGGSICAPRIRNRRIRRSDGDSNSIEGTGASRQRNRRPGRAGVCRPPDSVRASSEPLPGPNGD